ncbi:transglycosylase family protein [Streptomyces sp. AC602_WCS936]|uniref:transglycosylase family protein n=1 Tax=Streptomyces sp. AC602_WCS936 TaxID=2823685 RepID=UPI001C25F4A0|nr:transglycosylase family protein [Streptomyces sp. AC602_WCS936]
MLSGNGRHRRPRQAPALVVAAGVTGSAIAIPLLGATGAHAADGANWDRVAECETGGAWSQNSGNGYYGGLQISQEAWERYGGLEYARSADQASRSQQISVAEKMHADQGIAAWPTCGLLAGLGNDSGVLDGGTGSAGDGSSETADPSQAPTAPEADDPSGTADPSGSTGTTGSSDPSGSTGSDEVSDPAAGASPSSSPSPTSDPSSTGEDEASKPGTSVESDSSVSVGPQESDSPSTGTTKTDETDKVGQSDGSSAAAGSGESGAGRHRGDSADEGATSGRTDGRTDASSGRHASRGEGEAREVVDGSYTVRSGDSLWGIADSLELDGGWRSLYAGNKDVVGSDPDHILPGQTLTVTGESGEK